MTLPLPLPLYTYTTTDIPSFPPENHVSSPRQGFLHFMFPWGGWEVVVDIITIPGFLYY